MVRSAERKEKVIREQATLARWRCSWRFVGWLAALVRLYIDTSNVCYERTLTNSGGKSRDPLHVGGNELEDCVVLISGGLEPESTIAPVVAVVQVAKPAVAGAGEDRLNKTWKNGT
jgi:hypothetical protein